MGFLEEWIKIYGNAPRALCNRQEQRRAREGSGGGWVNWEGEC